MRGLRPASDEAPDRWETGTTVALTVAGHTPRALAEGLAARGIFVWDGDYYAINLMERLGLEERGGALRIGLAHYNTIEEVERIIAALREVTGA